MTVGRFTAALLMPLILAGATFGQGQMGGWLVEVVGLPVSPTNPSITVRVSAYFPSLYWAFALGKFDLTSTDSNSELHDVRLPYPLRQPCATLANPGILLNGGAYEVQFGQSNILGCIANSSNPLAIWEATWTTSDFSPRRVMLETNNTRWFHVYENPQATLNTIDLIPLNQFRDGSAVIQVIPAPSGAFLLACGAAMGWRRRRSEVS